MSERPGKGPRHPLNHWRVRLLTRTARLAITWEHLWPKLLPSLAVLGSFLATALFDILPQLPFWIHILALMAFAVAFGYGLNGALMARPGIDDRQGQRRLERDSDLAHRPLTALQDAPLDDAVSGGDIASRVLWKMHMQRMALLVRRLRVRLPSPGVARLDPFALRAVVVLVMIIAAAVGGRDAGARLERALMPKPQALAEARLSLDVWITPPAYTGLAPLFLEPPKPGAAAAGGVSDAVPAANGTPADLALAAITVPVGSTFLAQMGASTEPARIHIGERTILFKSVDPDDRASNTRAEGHVGADDTNATEIRVSVGGRTAAAWAIRVAADQAPRAAFSAPPKNQGRGLLGVAFEATDDYGLEAIKLTLRHSKGWPLRGSDGKQGIDVELAAAGLGTRAAKGQSSLDLSAHPWAGSIVELHVTAVDAAKQKGESSTMTLALPERIFNHPVARAIIAARKKLNRPGDAGLTDAMSAIEEILIRPHHFFDDTVVFLTLAVTRARLAHNRSETAVVSVQKLLWDTALRIEDGEFSIADRQLRDVQKNLMEALKNRRDAKGLNRLLDQLQQALDKYMSALAEHLSRQGLTDMPQNPSTRMMEGGDLQRMLDQIRELSRSGAKDAAKRMLAELNHMLDAIRNGARMARPPKGLNKGRQLLQGLRELTKRQQKMLDENFRRAQRRQNQLGQRPGQAPGSRPGSQRSQDGEGAKSRPGGDDKPRRMAAEQEKLRRELGRFMLQMDDILGAIPPSMGKADRAMKGAGKALGKGDRQGAVPHQTEALKQLRKATEGMAEQMARRMQGSMGLSLGGQGRQRQRGRDPFGRRPGSGANGEISQDGTKVPSRMQIRRSRQILDELRRRSGDRKRPLHERDYIERLIDQF